MILDLDNTKAYHLYMFLDKDENPLYIGISKNLTTRIEQQHFISKSGNLSKECIQETYKILYHQATSSDDMKIKERYLINKLNPKYNDKMNNRNEFNYSISVEWQEYEFNKEELLKRRENNEYKSHSKFRNYSYDFQNQKVLKLSTDKTIRTFGTCLFRTEEYYPNIEFPMRSGGYKRGDDFHFIKINNELYVFSREIFNFYDFEYPDLESSIGTIQDIKKLTEEYGLDSFVIVSCKEKKGIFDGGGDFHKLPNEVLFMKYEVLKKTGFLDKKWEELLEKAFIDFKKPHYSWLIGRCYTKEERLYAEKIYNEWEKKFLQRFKKVDNVIYI